MRSNLILILTFICFSCFGQKKPVIEVYLIGGQSNATGQGYLSNMDDSMKVDRRVLIYHSGKPHLNSNFLPDRWFPLHASSESPDRFGPELGFGSQLQNLRPKAHIAIIKHAHSGTNLYKQWSPGKDQKDTINQGVQYKIFMSTVKSGLDSLVKRGYQPVIKGMLWQQGESDADKGEEISKSYGKNLKQFIIRVRQDLKTANMLFVYGYVYPPPNKGIAIDEVRNGQREVASSAKTSLSVRNAYVILTDDLSQRANDKNTRYPKDYIHFGTKGTWELGLRMAEEINKHLK
jgi:lysophospholipase L1-like esterase